MYCSLDEAFQSSTAPDTPSVGSGSKRSKKKRTAAAMSLPPEQFTVDPDRPANRPLPPAEYVGGGGNTANVAPAYTEHFFPHPNDDIKESADAYNLEPDWAAQFRNESVPSWIKDRLAAKDAEVPLMPVMKPWMDGQPTLWKPSEQTDMRHQKVDTENRFAEFEARMEERLSRMFARLEDIDRSRTESNHMEIILFILGGFFLLLMLDMLVKQGMRATMMIANAAGGGSMAALKAFKGT